MITTSRPTYHNFPSISAESHSGMSVYGNLAQFLNHGMTRVHHSNNARKIALCGSGTHIVQLNICSYFR